MRYVIIGNSAAAAGTIEGIRAVDKKGSITLIADEKHHIYSRPLISYLLCGRTTEEKIRYRPADFYEKNGVRTMLGCKAVHIDANKKLVLTDSGDTVPYDRLMAALGSVPFVPPIEGLDTAPVRFTFMSLDDAKALNAALEGGGKRVLIIGAGLIGLKCAEGIAGMARSITIVDMADHVLPSILDEQGSALVQKQLTGHGITLMLGDSAASICGGEALLQSGRRIGFDVLVVAVGVRPNTSLLQEIGCQTARGVITDEHGQTSVPGIYSAGDCTESHDISSGTRRILALLPNAYMQGECAGKSMAGGSCSFTKAIPMNSMGVFGLHMITAGSYEGESYIEEGGGNYKRLITRSGRLAGFILIGDVARAGIYTSLIREQTPLDDIDFDLIREKPQLMAFSHQERAVKMAGGIR